MTDPQHEETFADTERKLREIITTLRAQLAEALEWDGRSAVRAEKAEDRAERAEAALAAQIEADATLTDQQFRSACLSYRHDFGMLDHDAQHAVIFDAREWWRAFRREIRNQPHDRTALDRMLAEAREKALREAAEILDDEGWLGMSKHRILALIEKPNAC